MFQAYRTEQITEFQQDLRYWSNALGELHHFGLRNITEDELPLSLQRAYNELWDDCLHSLCYLVEYKGAPYIALINEYDSVYVEDADSDTKQSFGELFNKAYDLKIKHKNITVLIAEEAGIDNCHEIIALINPYTSQEKFKEIAASIKEILP